MPNRSHIIDGGSASSRIYGLIYTEKCGWIDLGHANPTSALGLWQQIKTENKNAKLSNTYYPGVQTLRIHSGYFLVSYRQSMSRHGLSVSAVKKYQVKKGLTLQQKKSVALSIFLDISYKFEQLQRNWIFRHLTDSGFSVEDLVSNLLGFYRAVEPGRPYFKLIKPVPKEMALYLWDSFGGIKRYKNRTTEPYLFHLYDYPNQKAVKGMLPAFLNVYTPAKAGDLFKEVP